MVYWILGNWFKVLTYLAGFLIALTKTKTTKSKIISITFLVGTMFIPFGWLIVWGYAAVFVAWDDLPITKD